MSSVALEVAVSRKPALQMVHETFERCGHLPDRKGLIKDATEI